jgi:energy-coupling factor transporter ATP-binding protein EcfA2
MPPQPKPQPAISRTPAKTFSVVTQTSANDGERVLIYGKSGLGKTTLAFTAPGAVFIALDDGSKKLTGAKAIPGVESYQDTRDAIAQAATLIPKGGSLIIDTVTRAEALIEPHLLATIKTEKGATATSMEAYGWGKGYRFLLEHYRLLLADLDNLIRAGRNVILLAQEAPARIANQDGIDFIEAGPQLYHSNNASLRTETCAWVDYVLRIGYADLTVTKENSQARAGKVTGDRTRVIYSDGPLSFVAKSRPVQGRKLPPAISFASETDRSLWQFLFENGIQ